MPAALTPNDLDLFLSRSRNRPVFSEGDTAGSIYQVESGCIRLQKMSEQGRRCILSFCYPGDVFGLGAHGPQDVDAEAVCTSRISKLGTVRLARMLDDEPSRAIMLIGKAHGGQERAADHVVMISFAQADQKLAWFLCKLRDRLSHPIGSQLFVDLPMMRADIADYLGMTFETVSREMTKLRDAGTIRLEGLRSFEIIRPFALDAQAHGNSFDVYSGRNEAKSTLRREPAIMGITKFN